MNVFINLKITKVSQKDILIMNKTVINDFKSVIIKNFGCGGRI